MEPLAKTRTRRANAGNRMAAMLDKEEDDFYKSTYGGFFEEDNDKVYQSEDSESDNVDSDFDIDETDEVVDFEEGDESKKRKSGRLVTKAYQEPKKKAKESARKRTHPKRLKTNNAKYLDDDEDDEEEEEVEQQHLSYHTTPKKSESLLKSPYKSPIHQKKSLRTSTQLKSKATQKRTKLAEEARKERKRTTVHYEELTQEELLEEAKETEKINKKSLERYERLELEKSRKNKISRKQIKGPIIRYQSVTMPLISDLSEADNEDKRCSRNFISFSDEEIFFELFKLNEIKKVPPSIKKQATCLISKLPARYYDPVTQLPYSSTFGFRTLREAYYKQLEILDENQKTPEIIKFIEWRKNHQNVLNSIIKSETPLLNLDNFDDS